jgi:CRISPR-associated protein (TIGR03984 family)
MKANGLELHEIKSKTVLFKIGNLKEALSIFNSTGYIVVYLDYKVLIGKVNSENLEFYKDERIKEKYIQKLRIFNRDRELLIWRDNNELKGRLRIDGEGQTIYAVDANQVLWGTKKEKLGNGWIKLKEDRGTELIIPYDENVEIDDKKNRLFILTRNYIDSEEIQATYFDCRFVDFGNRRI